MQSSISNAFRMDTVSVVNYLFVDVVAWRKNELDALVACIRAAEAPHVKIFTKFVPVEAVKASARSYIVTIFLKLPIGVFSWLSKAIKVFDCASVVREKGFSSLVSTSFGIKANDPLDEVRVILQLLVKKPFDSKSETYVSLLKIDHMILVKVALLHERCDVWVSKADQLDELDGGVQQQDYKENKTESCSGHRRYL